jgi:Uncharacterized protein conserved in bacteria
MSVFSSQIRNRPWLWQITLLCGIFGALLAATLKTQDRIRGEGLPSMRPQQIATEYAKMRDTVNEQKKKIADLQTNLTKYQEAAAKEKDSAKLLYSDLQKANVLAGLVAVTGPGVVVTLRDSTKMPAKPADMTPEDYSVLTQDYIIHDRDIQSVINELRAAGAEAIAVNDQRVVATTAVRCVGPVVQVNSVPTNGSPVKIKAIGDPDALVSSLLMPNGLRDQYSITDPSMFSVDKIKSMTLPAYAGATPLRWAEVAPEHEAKQAQRQSEKATEETVDPISPKGRSAKKTLAP